MACFYESKVSSTQANSGLCHLLISPNAIVAISWSGAWRVDEAQKPRLQLASLT